MDPRHLLIFLCCLVLKSNIFVGVHCAYTVPTTVLSVSTFNSTTTLDDSTESAIGDQQSPPPDQSQAISNIRVRVFPGQDDTEAGAGLEFYGLPDSTSFQGGVNTQSSLQTDPCGNPTPGSNCSGYNAGGRGVDSTGPIRVEFRASPVVYEYNLIPTPTVVPYAVKDHSNNLLYCKKNSGPEGQEQHCSSGPAQYLTYDDNFNWNPWRQTVSLSEDPTRICRGENNDILGRAVWYSHDKQQDFVTPGCFGCPIKISEQFGDQLTTAAHFCPYHAGTPHTPPTYTEKEFPHDSNTGRVNGWITSDVAGLMPYYYWCYGILQGIDSDRPWNKGTTSNTTKDHGIWGGKYIDMIYEYTQAYRCTLGDVIDATTCLPYANVQNNLQYFQCSVGIFSGDEPACNDGQANCSFVQPCSAGLLEQVTSAVRFLTAGCSGVDTQEVRSGVTYNDDSDADPKGFQCPGDQWTHVRPLVTQPKDGFYLARCSAGCSNPNTITMSDLPSKNTNRYIKNVILSTVVNEKGTIELGPTTCKTYRIESQPRAAISLDVIITTPDGEQRTISLGTNDLQFGVAEFPTANFSARINRIDSTGAGVGRTVEGLIVICGTEENVEVGAGGRDVTQCTTLDDDSDQFGVHDTESCSVPPGTLRGVFPVIGGATENPRINPWPKIIRAMRSDFLERCADINNPRGPCTFGPQESPQSVADSKERSCATPTPQYLSKLNCGRRVSWYYVPPELASGYGSDCGQMGFRNSYPSRPGGVTTMCQQGGFTCTPGGFGGPRFGQGAASSDVKTPCQEQGRLAGFQYDTQDYPLGCNDPNVEIPLNLPPVFRYGGEQQFTPGDFEPQSADDPTQQQDFLTGGVPNTWINERIMYTQPTDSEGASISLDVELITSATFGGELIQYTGGTINASELFFCDATVSEAETGSIAVEFCNTNPSEGGRYSANTVCSLPETVVFYSQQLDLTIDTDPPIDFDLGPGACTFETWRFQVSGPIQINEVFCTTTLFAGPSALPIATLGSEEFSCLVKTPSFQQVGARDTIGTFTRYDCAPHGLFCQLSKQSPWVQTIIYIVLLLIFFSSLAFAYMAFVAAYSRRQADKAAEEFVKYILKRKRNKAVQQ